jgi:hypothetical protein
MTGHQHTCKQHIVPRRHIPAHHPGSGAMSPGSSSPASVKHRIERCMSLPGLPEHGAQDRVWGLITRKEGQQHRLMQTAASECLRHATAAPGHMMIGGHAVSARLDGGNSDAGPHPTWVGPDLTETHWSACRRPCPNTFCVETMKCEPTMHASPA